MPEKPIKILFGIYDITMSMRSPMSDVINGLLIMNDYGSLHLKEAQDGPQMKRLHLASSGLRLT